MNTNIMELNNEEKLNPDNDVGNRATTEIKEPKTEEKKKKPKKKITKRKSKQIPEEKQDVIKKINFDNIDKAEKIEANQDKTQNDNILLNKIEENDSMKELKKIIKVIKKRIKHNTVKEQNRLILI